MPEGGGARERRKRLTRETIAGTATALFRERGYDAVSVNDIARAAGVSKMTVFNYFDSKEQLLLSQLASPQDEPAAVVRRRPAGTPALTALRSHFVLGVQAHDRASGLCPDEDFVAFRDLIAGSRNLLGRFIEQAVREQRELTAELLGIPGADELGASLAASQIVSVRLTLVEANFARIRTGRPLAEQTELAVADADRAFAELSSGLGATPFGE